MWCDTKIFCNGIINLTVRNGGNREGSSDFTTAIAAIRQQRGPKGRRKQSITDNKGAVTGCFLPGADPLG